MYVNNVLFEATVHKESSIRRIIHTYIYTYYVHAWLDP